jgi:peptidoglycan/xylan/chitin deacetylase (PgdA/CDA1 family)
MSPRAIPPRLPTGAAQRLKRSAVRALSSKVPYALLRYCALRNGSVTILAYHTLGHDREAFDAWTAVRIGDFRRQFAFVQEHYDIVSLDEAIAHRGSNRRRPSAVITFDDGDVGLHTHLLPFVEEAKVPVTIYVATQQIETGEPFWFDRITSALHSTGPLTIDLRPQGLRSWTLGKEPGPRNWAVISDLLETLKSVTPDVRLDVCESILAQAPTSGQRKFVALAPLSIAQLRELSASRWVTIGSHSHCHSLLDQIPLPQAVASIEASRRLLKSWTGQSVHHFAYPNGNHNPALESAVSALGLRSAATLGMKLWTGATNLFALPRIAIGRYDDVRRFKLRLAGL